VSTRTYTTIDKSGWGAGPWRDEPDKMQWIDEPTGLDCLIVRNWRMGNLCGYVGVPPGHRLHGRDCNDVDAEVHGGLTFANSCDEDAPPERGICHVPEPGRPADVWRFGFDCAHFRDLVPGMVALELELGLPQPPAAYVYRDIAYVEREVASLAKQLAAVR